MTLILQSPVRSPIHPTSWKRPAGNHEFRLTQDFGPATESAEPKVVWPGGDGIPAGTYPLFHQGIDLGDGGCGADVLAAAAGIVDFAGLDASGNRVVIVNHGGDLRTWYGHLHDKTVSKGAHVGALQLIGHVGTTAATACHLHFGLEDLAFATVVASKNGAVWHNKFVDPWRHLAQNVTVHPKTDRTVNIRATPGTGTTPGPLFAVSSAGRIHRASDKVDLGASDAPYRWGDVFDGAEYEVDGQKSVKWERMYLDGAFRFVASLLAVRSV